MYSSFQLGIKYLKYYLSASNGKGHGIHSPFVFDFVKHVLNDTKSYTAYNSVEKIRKELLQNHSNIEVEDFGAGSALIKTNTRVVSRIAASSLKSKKYAQLLFRIVRYYQPGTIIELGTSFGTTTAYLAFGNTEASVYTLEGATAIAAIAKQNFEKAGLKNIQVKQGNFDITLPGLLTSIPAIDLVYIDGNHRKEPTLHYFDQFLKQAHASTIFIFDDIHWSKDMEEAWSAICGHPRVTLSIDLFFIGLIFINPDFKVKQDFTIRY